MSHTIRSRQRSVVIVLALLLGLSVGSRTTRAAGTPPAVGDLILNEYASDNDASANDFLELLVQRDGVDLRGLRISDNELTDPNGALNINESVLVLGNDAFLSNVPRGTTIAIWLLAAGVSTDTVVDPAAGDWKMVLAPGTGVTTGSDGLGGSTNVGLATGGDALYVYLTGPDGSSAGTDNVYLDFVSWEDDGGAVSPAGLADVNLPSLADNAYYTGMTAAGNDTPANWVRYDFPAASGVTTPGDPNPTQDLSALRGGPATAAVVVTPSGGATTVTEGGAGDSYTLALATTPAGAVQIEITADAQTQVSTDGIAFSHTATVTLTSPAATTITVQAIDDGLVEGLMTGAITHSIVASADPAYSNALTPVASVPVSIVDNDVSLTAIHTIQGPGSASILAGSIVTTTGVVTGLKTNGFFLQEPDATTDGVPETSEGIFVFVNAAPTVRPGDALQVTGRVSEFVPAADPFQPPLTELITPSVSVFSSANVLPAPVELTATTTTALNAAELLERLEGMRVSVPSLTVIGPTLAGTSNEPAATSTSSGVFYGVVTSVARPFREAGIDLNDPLPAGAPCCVPRFDGNPERLRVDSDAQPGASALDVATGVTVTGMVGPLDYSFRTYTVNPDPGSASATANAVFTPAPPPTADELTVAGLNVERFFDTLNNPGTQDAVLTAAAFQNRLNKLSLTLRNVLRLPDIVGVVEMENLPTLQAVADKVNSDVAAGGAPSPIYVPYLAEGNDIGGIDVGFLVKSSRVTVLGVRQEGKETTYTNPNNGQPELLNDRPPLVLEARAIRPAGTAFDVTVIVNHLRSLNGVEDPADGARVRAKRRLQAEFLATLIQGLQIANPATRILSIGDYNAFQVNDGYVDGLGTIRGTPTPPDQVTAASPDLVAPDLVNLVETLPAGDRYSYVFDGNAQVLDHALANAALTPWVSRFTYTRSNADFPDPTRNDPNRPERVSDHDGYVTYLAIGSARLTGRVVSVTPRDSASQMTVNLSITNTGGGNARSVVLDQILMRSLSGSGTLTLVTPAPVTVGDLQAGQSTIVSIVVNVPAGISRFSITENGSFVDPSGARYRFSMAQSVTP